ncbi:MAG TPA: hypothetical protein DEQ68_03745 [Ruminococcaceae bacterium]|nr:hypothetical protein [Oscillospiraceae bacterium]
MRRFFAVFALISALFFAVSERAFADEIDYGRERIESALPDEAREILDNGEISPENSGALNLTFGGVLSGIWGLIKSEAAKPFTLFCVLGAIILLSSLADSISEQGNLKDVFMVVGVLCAAAASAAVMNDVLGETLSALSASANFMLVFIPSIAGIAAVLGHITTASAVNSAAIAATQLFSQLAANFLAPLCGTILGLSAAGAVHPQLKTDKTAELIKKFIVWGLTLIMTVFMSILSAQTLVASASDNTAIKAAKFMVSQGVPIVGGTISDAVNTFSGSLSLLKGSVGTYGIIAAAVILFPLIARIVCYKIALACAQALAETLGQKALGTFVKSCCSVMTIILSVSLCFLTLNFSAVILLLAASS